MQRNGAHRSRTLTGLAKSVMAAAAFAASLVSFPDAGAAAQENPKLATLLIEIWPEYDRPAALVILSGELATDRPDQPVTLRIPASSGGPQAVAFSPAASGGLFNLKYDRTDAADFITLRFTVPKRFFQVEFYDAIPTGAPDRKYTYIWPADLAVDHMNVRVQEPAGAENFSVQPPLAAGPAGPDGLKYWTAEPGARPAGQPLPIEVRYRKAEARTSVQILGLKSTPAVPPGAAASPKGEAAPPTSAVEPPMWVLVLTFAAVLLSVATIVLVWWHLRGKAAARRAEGSAFCSRCGGQLGAGDRFCASCGAPVRGAPS